MYILAIETTGPLGSVAIIDEEENITLKISEEQMNHLKDLMPMSQNLIDTLGIEKSQLSAVAASIGPGSFTGIRIGVSSARAIAQALNIPAVAVETLDSFKVKCDGNSVIVPIFNARRGQVYGAVYDEGGQDIMKAGPYMLTDVLEAVEKTVRERFDDTNCGMPATVKITFYGDGIDAYEKELGAFEEKLREAAYAFVIEKADKESRYQDASMTAKVALAKFKNNETVAVEELVPDYMRVAEAEQKLKDGSLAKERAAKLARFKAR